MNTASLSSARGRAFPANPSRAMERGAVTLWLVLGMVLVASLASAWGARAVLMSAVTSQSLGQRVQARYAAQAALAAAQAQLLQAFAAPSVGDPFDATALDLCPKGLTAPLWQCVRWPLGGHQELGPQGDWLLDVVVARDVLNAPHVWQLHAHAQHRSGRGQAHVRESVWVPTLAPMPPHLPDTRPSGVLHIPADTATTSNPNATEACSGVIWRSVFGANTPESLRAWSQAQERSGLQALSQPARSVYWIDSPADWTQSLGRADAPVLLVFSRQACAVRCPRMAAGVRIHGTVFIDAACDNNKMRGWTSGRIEGLLAIEGSLPASSEPSLVSAQAYARQAFTLAWPEGQLTARVQRVPGSQREAAP